jgi:cation:H+ antiporter
VQYAVHGAFVVVGVAAIVWGAEAFAEHLAVASVRLGVSTFALALLLAGAEPEELATTVTASLRHAPGIAFGDVIGANVAICLVALGVGAILAPLPFGPSVLRYGGLGLPLAAVAAALAWGGEVTRLEGAVLVGLYLAYVSIIWVAERRPPALGETSELVEAAAAPAGGGPVGRDLALVVGGVGAMALGAVLVVDGVRRLSHVEATQTRLGLVLVGFATAFELVVLAWSAGRRGVGDAVVAGVVGSFAYNVTMSLGAGALARPLRISDAAQLHGPWVAMIAALAGVLGLALPRRRLGRGAGWLLLAAYPVVAVTVLGR